MRRAAVACVIFVVVALCSSMARAEDEDSNKPPSLGTAGLLMFGGSYGASVGMATAVYRNKDDEITTKMFVPIIGAWLVLADDRFDHDTTFTARFAEAMDCNSYCPGALLLIPVGLVEYGWLVIDPIAQATGLIMALIDVGKRPPRRQPEAAAEPPKTKTSTKTKMSVKPTFVGTGPGVALSITEW
jgi:hypothetical protein